MNIRKRLKTFTATADTVSSAVYNLGFLPFAQLFRGSEKQEITAEWRALQRKWSRPAAYRSAMKA